MIKYESSDPKDPETNTWWVWIPIVITLVILFGTLIFERDFLYEGRAEPLQLHAQLKLVG